MDQTSETDPARKSPDVPPRDGPRPGEPSPRRRLNLLFPVSAFLAFTFIMSAMIVANPISHEIDGPFVRLMKQHGLTVMILQVIAIFITGIGAMWLESRTLAADSQSAPRSDDSPRD